RTSFRLDGGELRQVVHPRVGPPVGLADLTGLPAAERQRRIAELFGQLEAEPFRLDAAPLWRATLARDGEAGWLLLLLTHHSVVDGASASVIHKELTELCSAAAGGREPALPELPIQYADYAVWQRERLSGPAMRTLVDYWRPVLAGLPSMHSVPTDRPRPAQRSFEGGGIIVRFGPGVLDALPDVCGRLAASPFMVLCAAYLALLNRLSGRGDIVVGVPVAGRDLPELQPLVGMFVNVVALRVDTGGDPTFETLVDRVRTAALAMLEHQEMPYQRLVELLPAGYDPAAPPLYQLGFNYLGQIAGFADSSGTAESDLMLEVTQSDFRLEYASALFDEDTAKAIANAYVDVLAVVLRDQGLRLSQLPVAARAGTPSTAPPAPSAGRPPVTPTAPTARWEPPRTPAEELVAHVWAELLGIDRVGAHDEFFALGGHSLLALRVIARLSAAAEVELPIHAFFDDTTVAGVAAALERQVVAQVDELSDEEAERFLATQDGRLG
ncbi:MAG TPA: condensation domain-containing protein, partial [Pseudonocardiaceae bacterium]|nr:condensation domain-containing protein [Pseudonocardiaceae bacterium]